MAVISFQLKFYETTNVVQFVYKQEGNTPSTSSGASIGMTTSDKGSGSFLSVQSSSANPAVSNILEVQTISTRPATGQVYSFTPDVCGAPNGLHTSGYDNNSSTFKWETLSGSTSYQYTVSTSATPPVSGINTTNANATVNGLLPATNYYIHLSNNCGTNWRTVGFTTAVTPLNVPFTDSFETATPPNLPTKWRRENITNPLDNAQWESFSDATVAASGTNGLAVYAPYHDADNWAFTPSLNLTGGVAYKLRFKYAVAGGGIHALQVKIGKKVGKDSMMPFALFNKSNIDNDVTNGGSYVDTTILFTPAATGTWYVGFNYIATVVGSQGGFLVLDDISVMKTGAMPVTLLNFTGEQRNNQHVIYWQTISEQNNTGFEVQQSRDGDSFAKIGFVASQVATASSNALLSYSFTNEKLLAGINFYRLKQIDKDGTSAYSKTINIKPFNNLDVSLLQNPVHNAIGIRVNTTVSSEFKIALYSTDGRLLLSKNSSVSAGVQIINLPIQKLLKGTYRLHIQDKDFKVKNLFVLKD